MKFQSRSSIAYIFRNYFRLTLVALPVSVLLAVFFGLHEEVFFLHRLFDNQIDLSNYLICYMESFTMVRIADSWWISLIAVVLFAVTLSLLSTMISKHMRSGEMPIFPIRAAWDHMPTLILFVLVFGAFSEVFNLITVGVAFLLKGIGNVHVILTITFALQYIFKGLIAFLFGLLLVSFPLKCCENYRFNVAMAYSVRIMSQNSKVLIRFCLLYPVLNLLMVFLGYVAEMIGLHFFVYTLFFLFYTAFLPTISYRLYFDTIGSERRDIVSSIFD